MGTQTTEPKASGAYQEAQQQPEGRFNLGPVIDETVRRKAEELQVREADFAFQQRRAKLYATSQLFGNAQSMDIAIAQTMVRIDLGEGMGFSPAESLQGIDIIKNRVAISSQLRAGRMMSAGYSWTLEWFDGKDWASEQPASVQGCRLWLRFQGKSITDEKGNRVCVSFTKTDAGRMKLLGKDNWNNSPANMYFARVSANAQRFYAPHVLSANLPSIEEVRDELGWEATGSKAAADEVAERKIELVAQIKALTQTMDGGSNFGTAMAAAFGEKKWKKYFTACDVAELKAGLEKLQEFATAMEVSQVPETTPETTTKPTKATKEQNGAAIQQLIEENYPEGGNDFAKAMSYAFGNAWQKWKEVSAADMEEGLRLLKEHIATQ
jgi:hypothetical protein